jgi:hypothetical protein
MCAFSLTLATTVFSQRSTGWFSACPRRPTLEGHQFSITCTASLLKGVSYMTPPSAFVTHGHQNLDRCPELAVFAASDHDRPWHSPSVTSACAGSPACSDPLGGPSIEIMVLRH